MNYRHAYHAGNFADVLKHVVLMLLIDYLKKKPAPFLYLDTHAGRGTYDLSEAVGQRSGEYKDGIGRILAVQARKLPAALRAYVELVRRSAGEGHSAITAYPGSPALVAMLRRPGDRMVLVEKHPAEWQALRAAMRRERNASVLEEDGYTVLKAQLPPREKRGLVLIDPPYESQTEFRSALDALATGIERWPQGIFALWYPLSQRAGADAFRRDLRESGIRRVLDVALSVTHEDAPLAMHGCGLAIVNPPWQLDVQLDTLLPAMHALLAPEGAGTWHVEWLVPE